MGFLSLLISIFFVGCGQMGEMIQHAGEPTAKAESTTDKSTEQYQLEPYDGPKARVAVYRFQDQTAKGGGVVHGAYPGYYWYNPQIGNGMADMLNDALLKSDRFIVLDRQALKDVLQEQDLAATGRISQPTAAPIGQIEGADLLVKGAITEFEPGSAGARGVGALGFLGLPGLVAGAIAGGVRQSHVAMIIQVVDAKTSRLLFSTNVEGKANDFDLGGLLGGFGGGFGGGAGLGTWQKTPVEKAVRIAILEAVKELSNKTPKTYFRHSAEGAVATPSMTTTPTAIGLKATRYVPTSVQPSASESFVADSQRIRDAQEMLKQFGLDPGPVDGMWGNKTRSAVAEFQRSRMNLQEPSGRLDELTYIALKQATAASGKQSPAVPVSSQASQTIPAAAELPSDVFVKVTRATLLDSPGSGGKSVGTVTEGAKLAVQGEDRDSYFVVSEDGKKGWIYKSMIRK
jgi:curli biogenesis system outer membrane secretion channel CsgG